MNFKLNLELNVRQINSLLELDHQFNECWDGNHLLSEEVISIVGAEDARTFQTCGLIELTDGRYSQSPWFFYVLEDLVSKVEQEFHRLRKLTDNNDLNGGSIFGLVQGVISGLTHENERRLLQQSSIHHWASERVCHSYIERSNQRPNGGL